VILLKEYPEGRMKAGKFAASGWDLISVPDQ